MAQITHPWCKVHRNRLTRFGLDVKQKVIAPEQTSITVKSLRKDPQTWYSLTWTLSISHYKCDSPRVSSEMFIQETRSVPEPRFPRQRAAVRLTGQKKCPPRLWISGSEKEHCSLKTSFLQAHAAESSNAPETLCQHFKSSGCWHFGLTQDFFFL